MKAAYCTCIWHWCAQGCPYCYQRKLETGVTPIKIGEIIDPWHTDCWYLACRPAFADTVEVRGSKWFGLRKLIWSMLLADYGWVWFWEVSR